MVYAIPTNELRSTPAFGRRRRLPPAAAAMLVIKNDGTALYVVLSSTQRRCYNCICSTGYYRIGSDSGNHLIYMISKTICVYRQGKGIKYKGHSSSFNGIVGHIKFKRFPSSFSLQVSIPNLLSVLCTEQQQYQLGHSFHSQNPQSTATVHSPYSLTTPLTFQRQKADEKIYAYKFQKIT